MKFQLSHILISIIFLTENQKPTLLKNLYDNKNIITGAGGSIGSSSFSVIKNKI